MDALLAQDTSSSSSLIALILPILSLLVLGAWIWSFADMVRHSGLEWDSSGQSPVAWVLIVIFLPILGLIAYLTVARPKLKSSMLR
jgi:hypothetical protein